jgi:hypothetical protein
MPTSLGDNETETVLHSNLVLKLLITPEDRRASLFGHKSLFRVKITGFEKGTQTPLNIALLFFALLLC